MTDHQMTKEEIRLVKSKFPDLSDTELAVALRYSQQSGLDILGGQLGVQVFNKNNPDRRQVKYTVTIEAMRSLAARTSMWEGSTEVTLLCRNKKSGEPEQVPFHLYDPRNYSEVISATVGVYRKGFREPRMGTALMENYRKTGPGAEVWNKLPEHMLGLAAERIALRGAFPMELGRLYGKEELPDDGESAKPATPPPAAVILPRGISTIDDVLDRMYKTFRALRISAETENRIHEKISEEFGTDQLGTIDPNRVEELYAFIKRVTQNLQSERAV